MVAPRPRSTVLRDKLFLVMNVTSNFLSSRVLLGRSPGSHFEGFAFDYADNNV